VVTTQTKRSEFDAQPAIVVESLYRAGNLRDCRRQLFPFVAFLAFPYHSARSRSHSKWRYGYPVRRGRLVQTSSERGKERAKEETDVDGSGTMNEVIHDVGVVG
jgi:hypothetical protein